MTEHRPHQCSEPGNDRLGYTDDDTAFLKAVDEYKRRTGRQFPDLTELLDVLKSLGWRRVAEPGPLSMKKKKPVPPPPETRRLF